MDNGPDSILGIVLRNDLMHNYTNSRFDVTMEKLLLPVTSVAPDDSIGKLLDDFISQKEHIFMVVNEFGATEGLITLEDAIETLLGVEIVDEDDSVEDMQQLARELWEQKKMKDGKMNSNQLE